MKTKAVTLTGRSAVQHADEYARCDVRKIILEMQLWLLGITPFLTAMTAVRVFDDRYTASLAAPHLSGWAHLVALVTGRGAAFLAVVGLLAVLPTLRFDAHGKSLALGFSALAASSLVAARLGTEPGSMIAPLILLTVGATWYFSPAVDLAWLTRRLTLLFRFYTVGSLLAALVASGWALESGYGDSILPGLHIRLHGLVSHANNLAPLILLGIILERLAPKPGPMARVWSVTGWFALVLTQSKTTFLAAGAILLVEWFRRSRGRDRNVRLLADVFAMCGVLSLAVFIWNGIGISEASGTQAGLQTFHARQEVWDITLGVWRANPIFGFGPNLWGPEMRLLYLDRLGWAAPHAHNQLVQTLGEAGLVGAFALLYYVTQILRTGMRHVVETNGASLALVVLVLVRCLTETPLTRADVILPLSTFVVLLTVARSFSRPSVASTPSRERTGMSSNARTRGLSVV